MITIPITADLVHGAAELETTEDGQKVHRLPAWVRRQFPDPQLIGMETQPAGCRVSFRTSASCVELVLHTGRVAYLGAERPRGHVDIHVDGALTRSDVLTGGDALEVDIISGGATMVPGGDHTVSVTGLAGDDVLVELWLPHNESTTLVSLRADAQVRPDDRRRPRWVHYGSSISQGSAALEPSATWPALAARAAGLDLRNLGFGGSAMADQCLARVIRDEPADVISIKLGINIVNADAMRMRALLPAVHGFLDTIRDGHPETPIVLVSPLHCSIHEATPGPGAFDPTTIGSPQIRFLATGDPAEVPAGRLTLGTIRTALRDVVAQRADANLRLVEGTDLFGELDEHEFPLADGLHPSAAAHRIIAERFVAAALVDPSPRIDRPAG